MCTNLQKPRGDEPVVMETGPVNLAAFKHKSACRWHLAPRLRQGCNLTAATVTKQAYSGVPLLIAHGEGARIGVLPVPKLFYLYLAE